MITLTHTVDNSTVTIHVPEDDTDLDAFQDWLRRQGTSTIALDTETNGLHIFGPDFTVRTVQFGNAREAWVIRTEMPRAKTVITEALDAASHYVLHNAPFDALALSRVGLGTLNTLLPKCYDTYILAHLLDSRSQGEDGAIGLSLKALSSVYVDSEAADTQNGLTKVFRSEFKATKKTGWAAPGLTDHPVFLLYAGLDVIYTSRLLAAIGPMVKSMGFSLLARREHTIQQVTTRMVARGVLVDVDYTERLVVELEDEAEHWRTVAKKYGVDNVNSPPQVAAALEGSGATLTARTASGALSVDKDVLLPLAGLTPYWTDIPDVTPNPVAEAVAKAKRAEKWNTAYVKAFLDRRDASDRVHPDIKALAARTSRMTISVPPLQQLPSGDWRIRRCLVADDSNVFISSDFSQIELRVIAANAGVANMIDAIRNGEDLHDRTANLIWGRGQWTKKQRGIAKNVAFGRAYGAGPTKIAQTAGIPYDEAKSVYDAYSRAYPELDKYASRLQREASQAATREFWAVTTAYGRRLPLSRTRSYAALNYVVQSTARDLFADAMLDVSAELDERLVLPIHDEILHQAPLDEAEEQAARVAELMSRTYKDVPIAADSDVLYGGSWGSGYGIPMDMDYRPSDYARKP